MKLERTVTAAAVAELLDARVTGVTDRAVAGLNEINRVEEGDLVYVDHPKYYAN